MNKAQLEAILLKGFGLDDTVACPKCKGDYNHLLEVTILGGDDESVSNGSLTIQGVNRFSLSNEKIATPNRIRQLGVVITFGCEFCGSGENMFEWHRVYSFHKGRTFIGDTED